MPQTSYYCVDVQHMWLGKRQILRWSFTKWAWCLWVGLLASTPFRACYKLSKLSSMNEIFNLLFQLKTIFCFMAMISVVPTVFGAIPLTGSDLMGLGLFKTFSSSTQLSISLWQVVKGMYHSNTLFFPLFGMDLRGLPWESPEGPPLAF